MSRACPWNNDITDLTCKRRGTDPITQQSAPGLIPDTALTKTPATVSRVEKQLAMVTISQPHHQAPAPVLHLLLGTGGKQLHLKIPLHGLLVTRTWFDGQLLTIIVIA